MGLLSNSMWYLTALIFGIFLLGGVICYARREAKHFERLESLKREAKEIARAQAINDSVRNMSIDSVRDKLQQTKQ